MGAGATQQLQQYGFCLIIDMMRREQNFALNHVACKACIARLSRRRFQPMFVDFHARNKQSLDRARDVQIFAEFFCMMRPRRRSRLQPMVHVHRTQTQRHLVAQDAKGMQQYTGIETAAEGDF